MEYYYLTVVSTHSNHNGSENRALDCVNRRPADKTQIARAFEAKEEISASRYANNEQVSEFAYVFLGVALTSRSGPI